MSKRPGPESFSHADFTAAVAAETGVPAAELTRRADAAPDAGDPLLAAARRNNEQRPEALATPEVLRPLLDQYDAQLSMLDRVGILGKPPNGMRSIEGIDGEPYTVPTAAEVERSLSDRAEVLEKKFEAGFTRLLLVPFGMPIDRLTAAYGEAIKEAHSRGKLLDVNGQPLELDTNEPVWTWDEMKGVDVDGRLVYRPNEFSDAHGGLTKAELLQAERLTPGWQVVLVEDFGNLPKEGEGKVVGDRPQLVTGRNPNDDLNELRSNPIYDKEVGMTPEMYFTLALTKLQEDGRVPDTDTGTNLTGAWLPGQRKVPYAYWNRGSQQARLGAAAPDSAVDDWGARSAVRVT